MPTSSTRRRAADAVDLTGLTALVTGATSGIGLACAQRLASAGAKVTVLGRDRARVGQVADAIGGQGRVVNLAIVPAGRLGGFDRRLAPRFHYRWPFRDGGSIAARQHRPGLSGGVVELGDAAYLGGLIG